MSNILKGTTTYLVGQIQYKDGRGWREVATKRLKPMGIRVFDPYNHPFVNSIQEGAENTQDKMKEMVKAGQFDEVSKLMKQIRVEDLASVDLSTFIVAYIDINAYTCGTWEEIFWANRLKRPIFLICEQGKKGVPLWLFGTIPHKYMYNSLEEALTMIEKINSGEVKIDSDRWRILRPEFL
jgi:hypothetical protein